MRCVAGAGLFALVGCNQIFGIVATAPYDAPPDADVPDPLVTLDWQVADVDPTTGAPEPNLASAPIAPAPAVRVARFDCPTDAPADCQLTPALYAAGAVAFPRRFLGTPWRFEYTLADGVPREVQWNPADGAGHVFVPRFGRTALQPVPVDGGYTTTPAGGPQYTATDFPRVLTTGLWSDGPVTVTPPSAEIDYDFAGARWLTSVKGSPDPARGDRALVVDYQVSDSCRRAVGSAEIDMAALSTAGHSVVASTWSSAVTTLPNAPVGSPLLGRLTLALKNENLTGTTLSGTLWFGYLATTKLPGLTETAPNQLLPVPMMQTLLDCPYNVGALKNVSEPSLLQQQFPSAVHVQVVSSRTFDTSLSLASGMETVITTIVASGAQLDMAFPAAIPATIVLTTPANLSIPLVGGTTDHIPIGATSGALRLDITPEDSPDTRSDYYDVLLHRIVTAPGTTALTTERIYTVTEPAVRIAR